MTAHNFKVGGALTLGDKSYVVRKADRDVLAALGRMDYLLIIEPRQQGKTSLINRLISKPPFADMIVTYVDVSTLDRTSGHDWLRGLCSRLLYQLKAAGIHFDLPIPHNSATWREFLSVLSSLLEPMVLVTD